MRSIPGKTLILISFLVTLTVALLGLSIWIGSQNKPAVTVATVTPTPTVMKTASVSFFPAVLDLSTSTTPSATVDIIVETAGTPITGAQAEILYDPKQITNVKILPSETTNSLFGNNPGSHMTLFTDTSVPGKLTFAEVISTNGLPVNGTGSIGKLAFTVIKGTSASASITFGKETKVTTNTTQGSILKDTRPLTITLQ
ncbi:MAG: hypothetical protein KBC00_01725 [Candidatus Levybacteria bacterium]|nr:hypothetical protein [Candidatus Levybacteria bacterium]MBP9815041.1 hypothetical protein [Candidatus Levybacteria bacterium]